MDVRRAELCVFDSSGEYLAIGGRDGEVRIWETGSGQLKQRFVPGQSGGEIKCLAWSRTTKEKRKRRSSTPQHAHLAVAIGNDVIVWNITKGEKEKSLTLPHTDSVNGVSWGRGNQLIYSGSSNRHIFEWDIKTGQPNYKWKADKQSVNCVCCHDDGELLLSAGRGIKLWSLNDYSLLKKFTGHSTSVRWMAFVDIDLFLSIADNDRIINLWSSSVKSRTAVGALTCDEDVMSCDVRTSKDKQFGKCAATSVEGLLHLFTFPLTNQIVEPVSAFSIVQFATDAKKESTPTPLPILAAHLSTTLTLAHTSSLRPQFETMDFNQSERRVCLLREATPGGLLLSHQKPQGPKVTPNKVTILGPGNMTIPTQQTQPLKSTNQIADSIPMSERLNIPAKPKPSGSGTPSAESLTQLLSQAIASGDGKLLEEVLRVNKEKVVVATIRRLPVSMVLPFLRKLIELLQSRPARGLELSLWIRTILTTHTAYLMTVPQLVDSLSGLYQLLDARVTTFSRLSRLQGKLDLMLMQAAALDDDDKHEAAAAALNTPLLTVTVGDNSVSADRNAIVSSDDEDWSSESVSSLSEDSDQSDHNSSDVAMETEHSPTRDFIR